MAHSQFDIFLQEATHLDKASDHSLNDDRLYGLYTSWCVINRQAPGREASFWAAMKHRRITPGRNGLRMKGPAAADYILASCPGIV